MSHEKTTNTVQHPSIPETESKTSAVHSPPDVIAHSLGIFKSLVHPNSVISCTPSCLSRPAGLLFIFWTQIHIFL